MGLRKDLKKVIKELENLKKELTPEIIEKAKRYDQLLIDLEEVKFKVSNVTEFVDDFGNPALRVTYKVPEVNLFMNDSCTEFVYGPMFRKINELNLIELEDMQKLAEKIGQTLRKVRK